MNSPAWNPLGAPLPPVGRATLSDDGRGGLLLFLESDQGPVILRWNGAGFSLVASSPFGEDEHVNAFFGCSDPRAEEMTLVGAHSEGLILAPEKGGEIRRIAAKGIEPWNGCLFAMVHPRHRELWMVLPGERARTVALHGDKIKPLAESENMMSIAWDPRAERLLGVTVMGEVYGFDGKAWSLLGRGRQDGQLAWHPRLGAVVQLISDDRDGLQLAAFCDGGWVMVEPEMRLPTYRAGFALGVDAGRDQVVMFGGQDFDKGCSLTNESFVSTKGGPFESTKSPAYLPVGRYNTACTLEDGALVIINHSALTAARFEGDRWLPNRLKKGDKFVPGFDDRGLNFAASRDGIWALDAEGALLFAPWGKPLSRAAKASGGPGTRYSGRVAMAWDGARRRVVLFGGESRNDTWVFEGAKWRELTSGPRPPAGTGGMCATPEGVMLLVRSELWRLSGDVWQRVGKDEAWSARTLLYDAKRGRLWSIASGKVATLDDGRFHAVAELPAGVEVPPHTYNASDTVGLDGARDQLIALSEAGIFALSLEACGAPQGTVPTAPLETPAPRPAPAEALRKAASFRRGKGKQAPPASIKVPRGYTLLAVLPADGQALTLSAASGLAVLFNERAAGSGWDLGGKATKVLLLGAGAAPLSASAAPRLAPLSASAAPRLAPKGLVVDPETGALVPFKLCLFDEVDPAQEEEFDTLPGNVHERAYGSKIGGFPRFIQGDVQGACPKCGSALRFAAQLGADTYCFGDVGALFVFVCPNECWAGAAVQCH